MSAEVETMAYAGEVPWHGLGVRVEDGISTDEMLKVAGLDWRVNTTPDFTKIGDRMVPTGRYSLVRDSDDAILTNVSDTWKPVQNEEAFEFFRSYVEAGDMTMHTVGSLNGGRNVWVLARVKDEFTVFGKKDKVEIYLLFSNPHQYGKSVNVRFTPIRVVCNNTLTLSLGQRVNNSFASNHATAFNRETVQEAMGIAKTKMDEYKEIATFLGSKKAALEDVKQYMKVVFSDGKEENRNSRNAIPMLEAQPGAEFGAGTWWSAFNATTFMVDHRLGNSDSTRLNSAWFGRGAQTKQKALETALEMAA